MSTPRPESNSNRGQYHVDCEQRDDSQHQGLVDRRADPLGTSTCGQAAVAANQTGDQAEGCRLDNRNHDLRQTGNEGQRGQVRATRNVLDVDTEDIAADEANHDHSAVEEKRDERGSDDTGYHQAVDRVDAEHLESVDLLTDGACPQVCAD